MNAHIIPQFCGRSEKKILLQNDVGFCHYRISLIEYRLIAYVNYSYHWIKLVKTVDYPFSHTEILYENIVI